MVDLINVICHGGVFELASTITLVLQANQLSVIP